MQHSSQSYGNTIQRDETARFFSGLSCIWIILVVVILQAAGQTVLQIPDTSETDHIKEATSLLVTTHKNKAAKSIARLNLDWILSQAMWTIWLLVLHSFSYIQKGLIGL